MGFRAAPLTPTFDPEIFTYNITLPFEHLEVQVAAESDDSFEHPVSTQMPPAFPVGETTSIVISVEAGFFSMDPPTEYTVDVTREESNTKAALSDLVVSGVFLNPGFDPLIFVYTGVTGFSNTAVTVTPTALAPGTTITVNGVTVVSGAVSLPIGLALGANQLVILSISGEGKVTKAYEVTVTRLTLDDTDADGMADSWESANGLVSGVDDGALDKDGDGLSNALEYALGSDPCDRTSNARPQMGVDGNGFLTFSFFQEVTDGSLSYAVEVCDPGGTWSEDVLDLTLGATPRNQVWRDRAGGASVPPAARWIRLRVTSHLWAGDPVGGD